ncbi:serine hydrolase [uncultured Massilia sp.]|uniref:serine hydrolase n=1 Tax=uncultured Massilia sp. TaxID=169973 RepID=UPI0025FB998E|nr:serine hydrolase [uncultured Massilia sp.]
MSGTTTACALLALTLPCIPAFAAASAVPSAADTAARIDAALAASYKPDAPGVTVIVVKDGRTVLRKAYGMADIAHKVPLAPDTPMRLGSITKQFTSTAILMLVDEGKVKLDDDITVYLPGYPTHGKSITVEHLLTHTSGIASYTGKPAYEKTMGKDLTVAQMIDSFKDDPLDFEPGTRYKYNNSGYFLLGAIVEKVSGMRYDEFVAQRIFVPLGMTRTAYEGHARSKAVQAVGYSAGGGGFAPSAALSMTQPYAAGAIVSTVDDLARWDAAVSSGKLLKAASWQRAFTPYTLASGKGTGYGYGWQVATMQGVPMIGHGGGINGFNTFAVRLPSEHVYVAVLGNSDSGTMRAEDAAFRAAAIAIGKPFPDFKAVALPAAALDAWSGVYRTGDGIQRTLRREGERFVLQREGRPPVTLQAYADNGFFIPGTLSWIELARGADGKAITMTLHQPDVDQVHARTGDAPAPRKPVRLDHARYDAYVGRYQLAPQFVLAMTREGDRYYAQASGQPKLEIFALDERTFFSDAVGAELRFDDAQPGQLVLRQGGRDTKGTKLP